MKKIVLSFVAVFSVCISFGQLDNVHRVLKCIPDSCCSLMAVDLDKMSKDMEINQIVSDNLLKAWKRESGMFKMADAVLSSWAQKDDKFGIDFTAVAAFFDMPESKYDLLLPLNNEKRFEAFVKKIASRRGKFVTMHDGAYLYRALQTEDIVVLCTEDVAYIRLRGWLTDFRNEEEASFSMIDPLSKELMMRNLSQMRKSHFFDRPTAKMWLQSGKEVYTCGFNKKILESCNVFFDDLFGIVVPEEVLDLEAFVTFGKITMERETARYDCELLDMDGRPLTKYDCLGIERSTKGVEDLLPFVDGQKLAVAFHNLDGVGDALKKFLPDMPVTQLLPLFNHPLAYSISFYGDGLLATYVDNPENIGAQLAEAVEKFNAWHDGRVNESAVEEVVIDGEESADDNVPDTTRALLREVGKMSVAHQQMDGFETYYIISKKMDWMLADEISLKEDTAIVVVKGNLMLWIENPSRERIPKVLEDFQKKRNLTKEVDAKQLFYAKIVTKDLEIQDEEGDIPVQNVEFSIKDNVVTSSVKACPGLEHGLAYEVVKYVLEGMHQEYVVMKKMSKRFRL